MLSGGVARAEVKNGILEAIIWFVSFRADKLPPPIGIFNTLSAVISIAGVVPIKDSDPAEKVLNSIMI